MKKLVCLLFLVLSVSLTAQETMEHELENVVVTAGRVPSEFSEISRNVVILDPVKIGNAPVNSIQDLLQFIPGVDVRQRGTEGIQSDVSIRGGSFEQVLVLIDGIKITDPQTGHHNMNLPVTLEDIDRIEVLKGQGSKIYGANAVSGVINIITKSQRSNSVSVGLDGGQNAYYKSFLSAAYNYDFISARVSASKNKSDGFQPNTDFDVENFSAGITLNTKIGTINSMFGYNDKKFGASGFYSGNNEWEHTTTKFFNVKGTFGSSKFIVTPKFYIRKNNDDYIWNRQHPELYRNNHTSKTYGFELQGSYYSDYGVTSIGGEFTSDSLNSNRLGLHERQNKGFFLEHQFKIGEKLSINTGAFAYDYDKIGWKVWPGIDFAYKINENYKLYSSIGKAFRVPSYTELYYLGNDSKGNSDLRHEETTNYELGLVFSNSKISSSISLFRKEGKNNIDWVAEETFWIASNFAEVNTNGVEADITLNDILPNTNINLGYVYLDSDKSTNGKLSRDYLEHLKHQAVLTFINNSFYDISQSWSFRYEKRANFNELFLVDVKFSRQISDFKVYISASNLLDRKYKKHLFAELPGRWIKTGIKYNFEF
ncbi:MAG: TonB-dependent receptor [Melioribacteraceae bacterium]|nr:TonB-dependent receptor [Melioribacteraceae bacterium]